MKRLFAVLLGLGAPLILAGAAGAEPLNWEGSTSLILGDFPRAVFTGGGVAEVNGSAGGLPAHLDEVRLVPSRGGIFVEHFTLFVTDPDTQGNSIASIQFTDLRPGTGTWGPISGGAASVSVLTEQILPVRGMVKICLFSNSCTQFLPLDLTSPDTTHTTRTVKGVGIGGELTIGGGGGGIMISLEAAPWSIKTKTVTDHVETTGMIGCPPACATEFVQIPVSGFAHGPASLVSSTADVSGVLQVVSPTQIRTNLPLGTNAKVASGLIAVMHFIPEPGLLLLLGAGVGALALLGHRRLRP